MPIRALVVGRPADTNEMVKNLVADGVPEDRIHEMHHGLHVSAYDEAVDAVVHGAENGDRVVLYLVRHGQIPDRVMALEDGICLAYVALNMRDPTSPIIPRLEALMPEERAMTAGTVLDLREALARGVYKMRQNWNASVLRCGPRNPDGSLTIPKIIVDLLDEQTQTPFDQMPAARLVPEREAAEKLMHVVEGKAATPNLGAMRADLKARMGEFYCEKSPHWKHEVESVQDYMHGGPCVHCGKQVDDPQACEMAYTDALRTLSPDGESAGTMAITIDENERVFGELDKLAEKLDTLDKEGKSDAGV